MSEVKVPMLPESVADATVLTWHKKVGDFVQRDENLVDLETDKVVLEVPAPTSGVLKEIKKQKGSTVTAEELLAVIDAAKATETVTATVTKATTEKSASEATVAAVAAKAVQQSDLSPSVRRMVTEHDVDVSQVTGTGKGGRVTREDVAQAIQQPAAVTSGVTAKTMAGNRQDRRVPMSRLRARIAERLVSAQHEAAMLTTFNEVNLKAVMELRAKYKDQFEKRYGVRLGFMSFFTRAVTEALKRFPAVNASIDGNDIVYHDYYDIGIAVSTERGLVVPVLRDADQLSMPEIEKQINDFAQRARDNKITMEDMSGGTFTITNGGVFGSLLATPIINPPQVGILGMHKIQERPVVENGQIVIRPMMYVALTYDHRIIDGKESVQFLVTVKDFLEDPNRLLLDV